MNLETTTESLCDQMKQYFAKQLEEKKKIEEINKEAGKILAIVGLSFLGVVLLIATGFLLRYLWLYWKSGRARRFTRDPKTPIREQYLTDSTAGWYHNKTEWKVLKDSGSSGYNSCTDKLKKIVKMVYNLPDLKNVYISCSTRIMSMKMNGFKNGEKSHEFEPMDGMIPGSHFTYQVFGDNTIQVTRYIVGGKSYVAGFCIYIKNDWVWDVDINMNVIKKLMEAAKYPGKEAVEKEMKEEELEKMKKAGEKTDNNRWKFIFKFWRNTQNDVPPSYSSLSIV